MQKLLLVRTLIAFTIVVVMVYAGSSLVSLAAAPQFDHGASSDADQPGNSVTAEATHCGATINTRVSCNELEQTILSTTLRVRIKTWIIYVEGRGYTTLSGDGHGTVLGGRYLLTHNHFRLPLLELLSDDLNREFATITLYTATGNLLWHGPLAIAAVTSADSETLLLDFSVREGQGFFDSLGVPSAELAVAESSQLTPGAPVAQINWDNDQAYVQWTQVDSVFSKDGTLVLRLADCINSGSSGGGVFFNGEHVANNWSRSQGCVEESDNEARLYSWAALNSAELVAVGNSKSGKQ